MIKRVGPLLMLVALGLPGCARPGDAAPEGVLDPAGTGAGVDLEVAVLVEGLEHPWALDFLPNDEGILVTERPGRLRLVRNGVLEPQQILGIPAVWARSQGGLLDVRLHPDFTRNRLVYLTYSKSGNGGATTAVARGRLEEGRLRDVEEIFVADAWGSEGRHFGSRILLHDGYLFVSIGDRGEMERAQDRSDHAGTIVRLHDDGRVPADNPFVGDPSVRDEIFSYGHRNVQGMVRDPFTGEVWLSEHGPRGGDELNRLVQGGNYGWPEFSHGDHYDGRSIPAPGPGQGIELPIHHWSPAIAPAGMTLYTGDLFPAWRGDIFLTALTGQHLRRIRIDQERVTLEETLLAERGERYRDVRTGPDGALYLLIDAPNAGLLVLRPAGAVSP